VPVAMAGFVTCAVPADKSGDSSSSSSSSNNHHRRPATPPGAAGTEKRGSRAETAAAAAAAAVARGKVAARNAAWLEASAERRREKVLVPRGGESARNRDYGGICGPGTALV